MTTRRTLLLPLAGLACWFAVPLAAAAQGTAKEPAKQTAPGQIEVRFTNGSIVVMTLLQDKIEIQTEYGKLVVPPRDIRHIDFGVHTTEEERQKIESALQRLSGKSYKDREAAVQELIALGPQAHVRLQNAGTGADPETAKRVEVALKKIREKLPARVLRVREDDIVRTVKFTVVGRITTPTLKARAEDFGELELRPGRLLTLHCLAGDERKEVVVDAATYGDQGSGKWMDTGVRLETRQGLKISATGQVDLQPQQAGTRLVGPDGLGGPPVAGGPGGGPGFGGRGGFAGKARASRGGALLGRIGENGTPFLIGSRFAHTIGEGGPLFLQIQPSPYESPSTGEYRVMISTGPFADDSDRGE